MLASARRARLSKLHIVSEPSQLIPPRAESTRTDGFAAGWDFYHFATGKGYVGVPDSAAFFGPGKVAVRGHGDQNVTLGRTKPEPLTINTNSGVIGTTTPCANSNLTVSFGVPTCFFNAAMVEQAGDFTSVRRWGPNTAGIGVAGSSDSNLGVWGFSGQRHGRDRPELQRHLYSSRAWITPPVACAVVRASGNVLADGAYTGPADFPR